MHPGGIADKVGNRYEAIWLIRHLVQLIDGRATAITIEAVGDEGVGFEFAIDSPDPSRMASMQTPHRRQLDNQPASRRRSAGALQDEGGKQHQR